LGSSIIIEDTANEKFFKLGKMSSLISDKSTMTKTISISLHSFELLQNHSSKYHTLEEQPISYDEIIQEVCNFYNKEHDEQKCLHLSRI
jgi:ABC-type phosphate/phosphonate transport system ATPase subunit